jgi:hypothetical protein
MPYLTQLLGQPLFPADLQSVDAVLYEQKVVKLLEYDENMLEMLDLKFSEEETIFGATRTVDLLGGAGGEAESVTVGNRSIYVKLLCHHLLTAKIREQTAAVSRGLAVIIPECMLVAMRACLTPEDLDVMIAGQATIDVDDWQKHTQYEGGYQHQHQHCPSTTGAATGEATRVPVPPPPQVLWFWAFVRGPRCDSAACARLLAFVTGSESVGAGGFSALQGYNGSLHKFTIRRDTSAAAVNGEGDSRLPRAQTCFNTLILPEYSTAAVLESKLLLVMMEGSAVFDEGAVAT